ncbi:MAG: XisI protein [Chloroflexi bacterium]|nr:XisI protein [Chloroflexota bacterium]
MEKLEKYRQIVQAILRGRVYEQADVEMQTIFDTERDHYQLVHVGWKNGQQRVYGTLIHIDLKDDKIWIQWDGSEDSTADELLAHNIPASDIVLGFHSPFKRQFTEFAVG